MAVWFTSDQHFSHNNIIRFCNRPYSDIHEMNKDLVERYNSVVRDEDVVYHLGDFALDERVVPKILPMLKGEKHLIVGNHDRCHPRRSRHLSFMNKYLSWGFQGVETEKILGPYLLCHFPYGDEDGSHEARYPEWRPKDEGLFLLHGHIHELRRFAERQCNVGVDQWDYTPITIEQIMEGYEHYLQTL